MPGMHLCQEAQLVFFVGFVRRRSDVPSAWTSGTSTDGP